MLSQNMTICLWFDNQAEQAVNFYASIFKNHEIGSIARFGKEGFEHHGKPEGSAMSIDFKLNGMRFIALNGGPIFKFNEAISIIINCDTQEEIDWYWDNLTKDGGSPGPCGWLKDKYGVSWQVTPSLLGKYLSDPDPIKKSKVNQVMFTMQKFDISKIEEAYNS